MSGESFEVTALGARGDGLVIHGEDVRFIPGGVPGDTAHFTDTGDLERVDPGPNRGSPRCSQSDTCGGCAVQHYSDAVYIKWLKVPIERALEHHGLKASVLDPAITPLKTRRRCTFSARWQGRDFVLGFAGAKSHTLTRLKDCAVLDPEIFHIARPLEALLKPYVGKKQSVRISGTLASNGLDILFEGMTFDDVNLRMDCAAFAQSHGRICRLMSMDQGHEDILFQADIPVMRFDGGVAALPVGGFTQATPQGEAALVAALKRWIGTPKSIADLFSGIGTFAIALTAYAKVDAFEASRPAVQALQAARLDKTRHGIRAVHRDLFRRPLSPSELEAYDIVVLDPPRPGAKAQCEVLAQSTCPTVLYVSCNANSFARDAKILVEGGYALSEVQPVGQFLWSTHVELAARFTRLTN